MQRLIEKRRLDPRFNRQPTTENGLLQQRIPGTGLTLVRDQAKQGPCWTGYSKVEGKADYAPGSCKKNGEKKKKKKKKKEKEKKDDGSSSSSSDDEGDKKKKSKD